MPTVTEKSIQKRMVSFNEEDLQKVAAAAEAKPKKELGHGWKVGKRYAVKQLLGTGAYGSVCEAVDKEEQRVVAIKRAQNLFEELVDTKRILREIAILRRLKHGNVIDIYDVIVPPSENFTEIYMVLEACDSDLRKLLKTDVSLEIAHISTLMCHLLVGLKYLHSAGVFHRDLKPANCLVNEDCTLKICDFGLARAISPVRKDGALPNQPEGANHDSLQKIDRHLTGHVVTRWYRAPELILLQGNYSEAIDIWSAGCIHAELLGMLAGNRLQDRGPLFPGTSCFPLSPAARHAQDAAYHTKGQQDQLNKVFDLIGTPSDAYVEALDGADARRYIKQFKKRSGTGLQARFPKVDRQTVDVIGRMLCLCPKERVTATEALGHAAFEGVRLPELELEAPMPIALPFEHVLDDDLTKDFLTQHFREESRGFPSDVQCETVRL